MSEPFLAEIKIISWNYAPRGWAFCNGQLLPINQNQALFALLGTTYGGNGQTTFALPDLRGRVPIHFGQGFTLGQAAGAAAHTLTISEMPAHTHLPRANSSLANQGSPANNFWSGTGAYAGSSNTPMNGGGITPTGGSQPHENRSPYLVLNFIIALQGIFPSQN
jgi:microcystin-dependent protein